MVKARKTAKQIRIANLVLRCILPLIANNVSRVPDSYLGGRHPTWSVSAVRNCNIRSAIFVKTEPNRVRPPPRGSPKSHGSRYSSFAFTLLSGTVLNALDPSGTDYLL